MIASCVVLLLLVECYALYVGKRERKAGYVCAFRGDACTQPSLKLELLTTLQCLSQTYKYRKIDPSTQRGGLAPTRPIIPRKVYVYWCTN